MPKIMKKNDKRTKNYRVGFPQDMLDALRKESDAQGVSLSKYIQDIIEKGLPVRLSELIKDSMRNNQEYEYTSFVITESFFDTLNDASKSVKLNVPELCRDILSHRERVVGPSIDPELKKGA
jgi:hypothetical protein